jgi:archaemetzincin
MLTMLAPPEDAFLQKLAPSLREAFGAEVGISEPTPLPEDAYSPSRDQYLSTVLLDAVASHKQPQWDRLLGIADVDLYVPDLNFVFGEADAQRGVAVFSLVRLHSPDRDRFVHRAATEAIHELGHTYGLNHCDHARCVMWFSNTLEETDRKGTGFCPTHALALQRAIKASTRAARH